MSGQLRLFLLLIYLKRIEIYHQIHRQRTYEGREEFSTILRLVRRNQLHFQRAGLGCLNWKPMEIINFSKKGL